MQALAEQDRTPNVSGSARCEVCGDDGRVVVGSHRWMGAEYDDMGPCPFCERGFRFEFQKGTQRRWPDGFWRGQELPEHLVEALANPPSSTLSQAGQLDEVRRLVDVRLRPIDPPPEKMWEGEEP